jgi:nucleoid-associated protein YgaU
MTTLTTLPAPPVRPAAAAVRVLRPTRHRSGPPRVACRPVPCEGAARPDLHGSRLTARGRVAVAAVWLVLAVLTAVPVVRLGDRQVERPVVTTTPVVVEPGDTLWALAREVDAAADPRAVIKTIIELNGLHSADIHPGDRLVVPTSQ